MKTRVRIVVGWFVFVGCVVAGFEEFSGVTSFVGIVVGLISEFLLIFPSLL